MPSVRASPTRNSPPKRIADANGLGDLPDELLLMPPRDLGLWVDGLSHPRNVDIGLRTSIMSAEVIFSHLAVLGPTYDTPEDPWFVQQLPFKHEDRQDMPHPRLRSYPFLGQVCKRWEHLLRTPFAQQLLWSSCVVDFGHELVTSIHTPLKWSNTRPSTEEFQQALSATTLSVGKMIQFVRQRQHIISSLSLVNSEGFVGDDGDYLTLSNKHNFQPSHLGYITGLLADRLQELSLYNCTDMLYPDQGMWCTVATCSQLRRLYVDGISCPISTQAASALSALTQLESLSITIQRQTQWLLGMEATLPQPWSMLVRLNTLVLRGHMRLETLPSWLATLPCLTCLDVSDNSTLNIASITSLTQLQTLSLQSLGISQPPAPGEPVSLQARRVLPDLTPLGNSLTALSLASNQLTRLPACLFKLTQLTLLDVHDNEELVIPAPINNMLHTLPKLRVCDFRGVHTDNNNEYWSTEKCATMEHLAHAAKQFKRRQGETRFLFSKG